VLLTSLKDSRIGTIFASCNLYPNHFTDSRYVQSVKAETLLSLSCIYRVQRDKTREDYI
jgi:hypothetical protein